MSASGFAPRLPRIVLDIGVLGALLLACTCPLLAAGVPIRERADAWHSFIWRDTPNSNDVSRHTFTAVELSGRRGLVLTRQSFERRPDAGGRLRPIIELVVMNDLPEAVRALRFTFSLAAPGSDKPLLRETFDYEFPRLVGIGQSAPVRIRPRRHTRWNWIALPDGYEATATIDMVYCDHNRWFDPRVK